MYITFNMLTKQSYNIIYLFQNLFGNFLKTPIIMPQAFL